MRPEGPYSLWPRPPSWELLPDATDHAHWERLRADLGFRHGGPDRWPGIREPRESVTFDIGELIDFPGNDFERFDAVESEFERWLLPRLRRLVLPGERLLALSLNHDGYLFDPWQTRPAQGWEDLWPVFVTPHGEYNLFLTRDHRAGVFGHPYEETFCIFGGDEAWWSTQGLPGWLSRVRRIGGREVA